MKTQTQPSDPPGALTEQAAVLEMAGSLGLFLMIVKVPELRD